MTTAFTTDHKALVEMASDALLAGDLVRMELPDGWKRPQDFPLPVKVDPRTPVREFRPLAIMEWVQAEISGEKAADRIRERHAAKVEGKA